MRALGAGAFPTDDARKSGSATHTTRTRFGDDRSFTRQLPLERLNPSAGSVLVPSPRDDPRHEADDKDGQEEHPRSARIRGYGTSTAEARSFSMQHNIDKQKSSC